MNILESPFIIAISPVLISTLVTLYANRKNKQTNPTDNADLVKELRRENEYLRKKGVK